MRTGSSRGLLLVLLLTAAGCGGAGAPASVTLPPLPSRTSAPALSTSAPPPSSAAASATTTAASAVRAGPPPQVPETKAGAELFIRDYYATLNAILSSASATARAELADQLLLYSLPSCECRQEAEFFVQATKAGSTFSGGGRYSVERITATSLTGADAVVVGTYSLGHVTTRDSTGRVLDVQKPMSHHHATYLLAYDKTGRWRLAHQM